jgi:transcriptional regulator with XRE-family HTH domain
MPRTKRSAEVWRAISANPAEYALWNPKQRFAWRLHRCMQLKGLSNSDLARLMWGETTDLAGHRVARNRDMISLYLHGRRFPEPRQMERLAAVLGVGMVELATDASMAGRADADMDDPTQVCRMTMIGLDEVRVEFDRILPTMVAAKIIELLGTLQPPRTDGKLISPRPN